MAAGNEKEAAEIRICPVQWDSGESGYRYHISAFSPWSEASGCKREVTTNMFGDGEVTSKMVAEVVQRLLAAGAPITYVHMDQLVAYATRDQLRPKLKWVCKRCSDYTSWLDASMQPTKPEPFIRFRDLLELERDGWVGPVTARNPLLAKDVFCLQKQPAIYEVVPRAPPETTVRQYKVAVDPFYKK